MGLNFVLHKETKPQFFLVLIHIIIQNLQNAAKEKKLR